MTVRVTIPGLPPSVNNLYPSNWRTGRRYLSSEGRAWHQTVADACVAARLAPFASKRTPLIVRLAFAGMTHQRDLDGALKAAIDALAAALGFDDRWVCGLSATRVPPGEQGPETRVELHVVEREA